MRICVGILTAAGMLWPTPLSAEPVAKSPTEKWVVNFDDAQCVAMRNYGTEQAPLYLVLKEPPMGDLMQVSIVRRGAAEKYAEQIDALITLDQTRPIRQSMIKFAAGKSGNLLFRMNVPRETFAAITRANTMRIQTDSHLDESFRLFQMTDVQKVLDQCVADLREVWNVTEKGVKSPRLKKEAAGTLQGLFSAEDYPGIALDEYQRGSVTFALLIDEKGKIADCTVIETSGVASLDAQSCATVQQRAHFVPAVGSDGKPAKASATQTIKWDIAG